MKMVRPGSRSRCVTLAGLRHGPTAKRSATALPGGPGARERVEDASACTRPARWARWRRATSCGWRSRSGAWWTAMHVEAATCPRGQRLGLAQACRGRCRRGAGSAALEKARRDLERARRLRVDEVATEEQVEDLGTACNVARADLETVRFNARFAHIDAPADGVCFIGSPRPANWCRPASRCSCSVRPIRLGRAQGLSPTVTPCASRRRRGGRRVRRVPGPRVRGQGHRIGAAADPRTGTFEVEIEVDPQGARFARGLVARVGLELAGAGPSLAARRSSRSRHWSRRTARKPPSTCWMRRRNVARRKQVALGPIIGEQVVVTAGLAAGEQVITDGAAWLTRWSRRACRQRRAGLSPCASGPSRTALAVHAAAVRTADRAWASTRCRTFRVPRTRNSTRRCRRSIVAYPGADPVDIERLIVDPIEDAISELDDIKRMDSRSLDGVGGDPDRVSLGPGRGGEVRRSRTRGEPDPSASCPPDIASSRGAQGRLRPREHRAAGAGQSGRELSRAQGARRVAQRRHRDSAGRAQQRDLGVSRNRKSASRSTSSAWAAPE